MSTKKSWILGYSYYHSRWLYTNYKSLWYKLVLFIYLKNCKKYLAKLDYKPGVIYLDGILSPSFCICPKCVLFRSLFDRITLVIEHGGKPRKIFAKVYQPRQDIYNDWVNLHGNDLTHANADNFMFPLHNGWSKRIKFLAHYGNVNLDNWFWKRQLHNLPKIK